MTAAQRNQDECYLEISCQKIDTSVEAGDIITGEFSVKAPRIVKGEIYTSDTRMRCGVQQFEADAFTVPYEFDTGFMEADSCVQGEFYIVSDAGEHTISYRILVKAPIMQSSLGPIRDLFQFTNLAKSNWQEAVDLFYSAQFPYVFRKGEKNFLPVYMGLSRFPNNEQNVEEFLVAIHKKMPITYQVDTQEITLEDVLDTTTCEVTITRSGWGYSQLVITSEGEFIALETKRLGTRDFVDHACRLEVKIDATKLQLGNNHGSVVIADTKERIQIHIVIQMNGEEMREAREQRSRRRALLRLVDSYVEMKMKKISTESWIELAKEQIELIMKLDEEDLMAQLFTVQVLLTQERFNEAKWYLDNIGNRLRKEETDVVTKCYYYYLTTLYNRDEAYLQSVQAAIETACLKNPTQWRLALLYMYMNEEYNHNAEWKWRYLQEQFELGCSSPALFCEAVMLIQNRPAFIMKLDLFEQTILWFAAKHGMLQEDMVEHVLYLATRQQEYSLSLLRLFQAIYEKRQTDDIVAAICKLLILGDMRQQEYFTWYTQGVERGVRVTRLYEYFMYSLDLKSHVEIPKMVLMYFSYQSDLAEETNAYLYAYVLKNKEKYPDLMLSYQPIIERFVIDQIRLGHIDDNLAYLYEQVLAPQMLRDETAYAFTPLLFMHRITVTHAAITEVVVIHEKINGESSYPVKDNTCMLPVYGTEYKLFLQDGEGNRFIESIPYENTQLMDYEKLLPLIGNFVEGRLSFDIFQCEQEKNYIVITQNNVNRFKKLVESALVVDSFKKEIRTKLLHFYYDNDMIGELDSYLEEAEAEHMDKGERAEFLRFLISRGMFDKAYVWARRYSISGVDTKTVARLISKHIVASKYAEDEFLIRISFYIFRSMRFDENILRYLMKHYKGSIHQLRDIWKAADDLQLPTMEIMERMLRQIRFTGNSIPEKNKILLIYEAEAEHDEELAAFLFEKAATDYFARDVIMEKEVLERLYIRYKAGKELLPVEKLALLKFWSEEPKQLLQAEEAAGAFVEELLNEERFFPFFTGLASKLPRLHYTKHRTFVEYRTTPGSQVKLHFCIHTELEDTDEQQGRSAYQTQDMKEMFDGIYVSSFILFHEETLQYYVTEVKGEDEYATHSCLVSGQETQQQEDEERYMKLNDILMSVGMQDDLTAQEMLEEFLREDYCTRELFRAL